MPESNVNDSSKNNRKNKFPKQCEEKQRVHFAHTNDCDFKI